MLNCSTPVRCGYAFVRLVTETWSHFPWARERLFALLAGSGAKTPIVLSGDTHFAEFAGTPRTGEDDSGYWYLDCLPPGLI